MTDKVAEIIRGKKASIHSAVAPAASVRGLGLIEVMISAFIICIAMIGVSRLHNTQVQIAHHQERRLAAMALLDDKLADLRLIAHTVEEGGDPDNDSRTAAIGNDRGGALSAGEISYDQYTFQLHWTVASLPEPVLKLLTVTVAWRDGPGKLLSVSGNTVIFVPSAPPSVSQSANFDK